MADVAQLLRETQMKQRRRSRGYCGDCIATINNFYGGCSSVG